MWGSGTGTRARGCPATAFSKFTFTDSPLEPLPEGPTMADVDRMGGCGNGRQLCSIPMVVSRGQRSSRGTRQTSSIGSIMLL